MSGDGDGQPTGPMTTVGELAQLLADEAARLDTELTEIELLIGQARSEAARHETRRAAAADKLAGLGSSSSTREALDLANQTVTLTRRSALMDGQVEILEAKKKATVRLRERVEEHRARIQGLVDGGDTTALGAAAGSEHRDGAADGGPAGGNTGAGRDLDATVADRRVVMAAQEDLRREIARQMHDGPAQSLTNIVLQAEIAERLVARDPGAAGAEIRQLVAMVQQTLEATKTFIFDVRPMVLDDLGLVPTLRRTARERGRRAGLPVEFESLGVDQRLGPELESGLFRIVDETLAAYLAEHPEHMALRVDWSDTLRIELAARRSVAEVPEPELGQADAKLPPALAAMQEERRAAHADAVAAAAAAAIVRVPDATWRDLQGRARALGVEAEVLDDGARIAYVIGLPDGTDGSTGQAANGSEPTAEPA